MSDNSEPEKDRGLGIHEPSSALVAEYSSLREEIREMFTQNVNLATFVLTASGAAIAVAVQAHNPIAALLPLFLLYFGDRVIYIHERGIARNAAYIKVVWEANYKNFQWETRLSEFRRSYDDKQWGYPLFRKMFICVGYFSLLVYLWTGLAVMSHYDEIKHLAKEGLMLNLIAGSRTTNMIALSVALVGALLLWTRFTRTKLIIPRDHFEMTWKRMVERDAETNGLSQS